MRRLVSSQIHAASYSPKSGPLQGYVTRKWEKLGALDGILTEDFERADYADCQHVHDRNMWRIFYTEAAESVFSEWQGKTKSHFAMVSELEPFSRYYVAYNTLLAYTHPTDVETYGIQLNVETRQDIRVCYLLIILIPEAARGKGHGKELYELVVRFAREVDCDIVVQTPSGQTSTGEPREEYLKRHGWLVGNGEAYIELNYGAARKYFEKVRS